MYFLIGLFLIAKALFVFGSSEVLDGAVLISMSRYPNRYETTKNLMEEAGFTNIQRFEAIDGLFTEEIFFKDLNISNMSPGEKGCAASHLLVWKNFVDSSPKDFLFVAEDDMIPHSHFNELFPIYWDRTPPSFDILLVGSHLYAELSERLVLRRSALNMHAYIISKKGAERLLGLYAALPSDETGVIDSFLHNMSDRRMIKCYCYNGRRFPDKNQGHNNVYKDGGICYQNRSLKSTIDR